MKLKESYGYPTREPENKTIFQLMAGKKYLFHYKRFDELGSKFNLYTNRTRSFARWLPKKIRPQTLLCSYAQTFQMQRSWSWMTSKFHRVLPFCVQSWTSSTSEFQAINDRTQSLTACCRVPLKSSTVYSCIQKNHEIIEKCIECILYRIMYQIHWKICHRVGDDIPR